MSNFIELIKSDSFVMEITDDSYGVKRKDGYLFSTKVANDVEMNFFAYAESGFVGICDTNTGICVKYYSFVGEDVLSIDAIKESIARFTTDSKLLGKYFGYSLKSDYREMRNAFSSVLSAFAVVDARREDLWVHRYG